LRSITLRALVERFLRARSGYGRLPVDRGAHVACVADGDAVSARPGQRSTLPSLETPTHYLRCRVLARRAPVRVRSDALTTFVAGSPASAHDPTRWRPRRAGAGARRLPGGACLLAELQRRHPAHRSAARLRAACPRRRDGRSADAASSPRRGREHARRGGSTFARSGPPNRVAECEPAIDWGRHGRTSFLHQPLAGGYWPAARRVWRRDRSMVPANVTPPMSLQPMMAGAVTRVACLAHRCT